MISTSQNMSITEEAQQHAAEKQQRRARQPRANTKRNRAELIYIQLRGHRKDCMATFQRDLELSQNSANTYYYSFKSKFGVGEQFELPEGYVPPVVDTAEDKAEEAQATIPGDVAGYNGSADTTQEQQSVAVEATQTEEVQPEAVTEAVTEAVAE